MLLSFSQLLNFYGQMTNNQDSTNVSATSSFGKTALNSAYRKILGFMSWDFVEKDYSFATNAVTVTNFLTFTNGSTSVTVSGSAISDSIVGMNLVGTDGLLYEITEYSHPTITIATPFLGSTQTTDTDSNILQISYPLPNDFKQTLAVYMDIGSTRWQIKEIPSREEWNRINNITTYQGTYPSWYYVFNNRIYLYPVQASSTNRVTVTYAGVVPDLTKADVTLTGTATFTNGSRTVGISTIAVSSDIRGMWVYGPDAEWYQVESYVSTTSITLTRAYMGVTATQTSTTIGQLPVIPGSYHDVIALYAAAAYYLMRDQKRSAGYKAEADAMLNMMSSDLGAKDTSPIIEDVESTTIINPNNYLRSIG